MAGGGGCGGEPSWLLSRRPPARLLLVKLPQVLGFTMYMNMATIRKIMATEKPLSSPRPAICAWCGVRPVTEDGWISYGLYYSPQVEALHTFWQLITKRV